MYNVSSLGCPPVDELCARVHGQLVDVERDHLHVGEPGGPHALLRLPVHAAVVEHERPDAAILGKVLSESESKTIELI